MFTLTKRTARRLFVRRQLLAGARPPAAAASIMSVARRLGCLQLDPTSAVAPSHILVLGARLGPFDRAALDRLLWGDRALFEYWAHAASIVLTEDYQIHNLMMRRWPGDGSAWSTNAREFMDANAGLRRRIMTRLRREGPLPARTFADYDSAPWKSSGWTNDRNVDRMLTFLWAKGKVLVSARRSGVRWWDIAERALPDWTPRATLPKREIVRRATLRALRALGVARPRDIKEHFTRGRYPNLDRVLEALERKGEIVRARVEGVSGVWYIHAEDADGSGDDLGPRAVLLSPFDNLICDRKRTEDLFDFHYRIEIYTPAAKRRFGYYVMPLLHGDSLLGRVDPAFDRNSGILRLNAVHLEDGIGERAAAGPIQTATTDLATHLGASAVECGAGVTARLRRLF
jgi:uncharacterized protein YcaQ